MRRWEGGRDRPTWQINQFRDAFDDCLLERMKVEGPIMNWSRGRGEDALFERLDRSLVNAEWLQRFPFSVEQHEMMSTSDHLREGGGYENEFQI